MNDDYEIREPPAPLPDPEAELKAIRRNLRRRNLKIVLTSVILAAAILAGTVKFAIPTLEKQYWNPTVCTYLEDVTDLELTMAVYTELFGHGQHLGSVDARKTGFATYSVNAVFLKWKTMTSLTDASFRSASLTKGELLCQDNFWIDAIPGTFVRSITPETEKWFQTNTKQSRETLGSLPDYIQVYASVTFPEDKSMEELRELVNQYFPKNARFIWAVLRTGDPSDAPGTPCGIHLTDYLSQKYSLGIWRDTPYPDLFADRYNWIGSIMERHVSSMLKFSADQLQKGEGILPPGDDPDYYTKTLSYIEENGVKAYGSYVIATPQALLEMMDEGIIAHIHLLDAWIGV